jgi:hypothetical protein
MCDADGPHPRPYLERGGGVLDSDFSQCLLPDLQLRSTRSPYTCTTTLHLSSHRFAAIVLRERSPANTNTPHHGSNAHNWEAQQGEAHKKQTMAPTHDTKRHETTRHLHEKRLSGLVSSTSGKWPRQLYFWKVASSALLLESGLVSFTSGKWPRQLYFWKVASSALLLESGLVSFTSGKWPVPAWWS